MSYKGSKENKRLKENKVARIIIKEKTKNYHCLSKVIKTDHK